MIRFSPYPLKNPLPHLCSLTYGPSFLRWLSMRKILSCSPSHFLTTHFLHHQLTMASDPTLHWDCSPTNHLKPVNCLFSFLIILDFSDVCATIKHSVWKSSLVFCNSVFSTLFFLFVFCKCLSSPHFLLLKICITQEFYSYSTHFLSTLSSITIVSMDSHMLKTPKPPCKAWTSLPSFQQPTHCLYKLLPVVLQGETNCSNLSAHDPGCNFSSGLALRKFLRFGEAVSSYIKGNKNPSLAFWGLNAVSTTISLLANGQISHKYFLFFQWFPLNAPFPFLHSSK